MAFLFGIIYTSGHRRNRLSLSVMSYAGNMAGNRTRSVTVLLTLFGTLYIDHMHAFGVRMGSSALLPDVVKATSNSLRNTRLFLTQELLSVADYDAHYR